MGVKGSEEMGAERIVRDLEYHSCSAWASNVTTRVE
jgi:hypothetical protein